MKPLTGLLNILFHFLYIACVKGDSMNSRNTMNNTLSISCWNSRGLLTSVPYLNFLLQNKDIVGIAEHWLHANNLFKLNDLAHDFNCISRSSRHSGSETFGVRRGQGGVAILWRKNLSGISPITDIVHNRVCGIRIQTSSKRVINIYTVYLPVQGSSDDFNIAIDEISEIINAREDGSLCIVCGDFNGDVGHLGGYRSNRKPTKQGYIVNNFFNELSMFPANLDYCAKGPVITFKGGMGVSTLDYIAIPECLRCHLTKCEVLKDDVLNTSDHYSVHVSLNIQCLPRMVKCKPPANRIKWNNPNVFELYNELTSDKLGSLHTTCLGKLNNPMEIDSAIDSLVGILVESSKSLPRTRFRKNVKPFWNSQLTDLKRHKVDCHRAWREAGRPRDPFDSLYINHKSARKSFLSELKVMGTIASQLKALSQNTPQSSIILYLGVSPCSWVLSGREYHRQLSLFNSYSVLFQNLQLFFQMTYSHNLRR